MALRAASVVVVVALVTTIVTLAPGAALAAPSEVRHRSPTDAPIIDRFRPPPRPWMSGNRGIDFGTEPGAPILASADGRVVFAGPVAGALHVTILHDDALRTSYSFVASITVAVGDRVRVGDVVAVAGGPFHFGVRTPDGTYLDPELLLAGRLRPSVHLVPGTEDGLEPLDTDERSSLLDTVIGGGVAAARSLGTASATMNSLLLHYAVELHPMTHAQRVADVLREWERTRSTCTDASIRVPVRDERRVVVLVSGLGTASTGNTALEIDTSSLGYAPTDVVPFSYSGGRAPRPAGVRAVTTPTPDPFRAIPETPFDAIDSQRSLSESADRLAVLLQEVAAAEPGVPIDVIAHSQGGVVARLAVERAGDDGRLPDEVATLVTIASPQQGAPLATAVTALDRAPGGTAALSQVRALGLADELDDRRPAIGDLAETSTTLAELHARRVPDRVRFVTIGGSGDVVVPGTSSTDPTADAAVILPTGVSTTAHGSMPSTPAATREIGLAVAGLGPTCRSLGSVLTSALVAETVRWAETGLGAVAASALAGAPVPSAD